MDFSTIASVCAIIIALVSLAVSIMEARATREHNRQSVRPVLRIVRVKSFGDPRTGLLLRNVGLGPAVVVETTVKLDGNEIGEWDRSTFDAIVGSQKPVPKFSTLYMGTAIPPGDDRFLIVIERFRERRHSWFWELIAYRLSLEIKYESLYGGEEFIIFKGPRQP